MLKKLLIALLAATALAGAGAAEKKLPPVEVYVPHLCLACLDWAEHLRQNGFSRVTVKEVDDLAALKKKLKVPEDLESVHTAVVAGYFVEGHVPAEDIVELLREKPKAYGIAVPGLPRGAPGREFSMPTCETGCTMLDSQTAEREVRREMFNTMVVYKDGRVKVWARH
ncbi:MAG: metal-binding protein [Rhodocyclaceae bacterium]|nr:metal-binding protein [Rhodocyclaceae bacterium]